MAQVVNIVTLDDLLFSLPEAQRPNIKVRRVNPTSGLQETVWERLRPEHVFVVKVDVEGFDGLALHGCVSAVVWIPGWARDHDN